MSTVVELFGHAADEKRRDWAKVVREQQCIFLGKKCYKVRKSDPDTSILRLMNQGTSFTLSLKYRFQEAASISS